MSVPVWLRKALSDQFVWFLVLGASLFALHAYFNDPARQIRLGEADVTMLASRWEAQTGSTPTPEEVNSLVEYHVREEILAREAMRLGLDAGDAIVRRRLVQKMELLIRDRYEPPAPNEADLTAYFAEHAASYQEPEQIGFRHIFLGAERDLSPAYVTEIETELADSKSPDAWRNIGKPFMLARQYAPLSATELSELFGPEFTATVLSNSSANDWTGPVRSAYGMHLVKVLAHNPATTPTFDQVRDRVAADYRSELIAAHEAESWRDIRSRYQVTYPPPAE